MPGFAVSIREKAIAHAQMTDRINSLIVAPIYVGVRVHPTGRKPETAGPRNAVFRLNAGRIWILVSHLQAIRRSFNGSALKLLRVGKNVATDLKRRVIRKIRMMS